MTDLQGGENTREMERLHPAKRKERRIKDMNSKKAPSSQEEGEERMGEGGKRCEGKETSSTKRQKLSTTSSEESSSSSSNDDDEHPASGKKHSDKPKDSNMETSD